MFPHDISGITLAVVQLTKWRAVCSQVVSNGVRWMLHTDYVNDGCAIE